jgi:hypothetical protein
MYPDNYDATPTTTTTPATPATGGGGTGWTDIIKALLAAMTGKYIDDNNAKSTISPVDAMRGSESKGVYGVGNRINDMNTLMQNTMSGANQNPLAASATTSLINQTNAPINPPQINQTLRNDLTAPNALIPQMLGQLNANKGRRQLRQGAVDSLLSRINQRMGTRNQSTGALTPYGK